MRHLPHALILSTALLAACGETVTTAPEDALETRSFEEIAAELEAQKPVYDLAAEYRKIAPVEMDVDTSFLSESERAVVNKLIEASDLMSEIYLRQLDPRNPELKREIYAAGDPDVMNMFDLHFGVCDTLNGGRVFYGDRECPPGAGFYPADMTKSELEAYIAANPDEAEAITSGYTLVRREGDRLVTIPYSEAYSEFLEPAAELLREAAELSEEPTLKTFLEKRADAFLSDDYFDSELAWMDLEGNIEIAIGPYEVYDDGLLAVKTAFESFVTVKNPEESAALAKYKEFLRDMEENLPVEDRYKNFKRGFESPIVASYQVRGGGDNVPGVQTIAFNLPNDERVREAKGAKKVILNNVLGAKYDRILAPIGERVLVPEQAALTKKMHMQNSTLFHELSHSLGPGTITVEGPDGEPVETTVNARLKELSSGLEEGKADVMGAYNVLYMMERGELDAAERESFLATYFTGLFRSMRFGIDAAHGKGAAIQYSYFRDTGAAEWLPDQGRYRLDFDALEQAISDLTGEFVRVQGDGDYDAAKAFVDRYARQDAAAEQVLGRLDDIPYDIRPLYPDSI